MCNDYGLHHPITAINQAFSEIQIPLIFPKGLPNLEPREDIRPTDRAPVVRRAPSGDAELVEMKWGFEPPKAKAGPVINFRGEGRAFGSGRCLIPASQFFEFTGTKSPKSKWKFTLPDEALFCIAGIWRPGAQAWGESFTMLTVEPGPDLHGIHDRQIVILNRSDWGAWLDPSTPAQPFIRACPGGALKRVQVR